ncbi:MAG: DUF5606 domain-containing protein [Bacteroidota bacterium]|nr:DUF5606 domain-containing protein [Bacteroidota bacterium]
MDLKDIIAIRGKGDLFRVISKSPKGIIVETLNEKKTKFKVQPNLHVLILNDITIFSKDGSDFFLSDVFLRFYKKDVLKLSITPKTEPNKIKEYFKEVVIDHDEEKVYISDMKKMIKWYNVIAEIYPDVIKELEEVEKKEKEAEEKKKEVENKESEEKPEGGK